MATVASGQRGVETRDAGTPAVAGTAGDARHVSEPTVPADGTCAGCGGERRFENVRPLYREAARADPFCSVVCARAWYGIPLPAPTPRASTAYVGK